MRKKNLLTFILLVASIYIVHAEDKKDKATQSFINRVIPKMYVGVNGGISFGGTTFSSFAKDNTDVGFNCGAFAGYEIDSIFSAELSLDYSYMNLKNRACCQNLWLGADGERYFAPVSHMQSYKYSEITAQTNLYSLGTHLNINLLKIWYKETKWSAVVSPALYVVYSKVRLINKSSKFHFGAGVDLGVGYKLSEKISLRLTTGLNYLTGNIDNLPREEHKISYIWNSHIGAIYNF